MLSKVLGAHLLSGRVHDLRLRGHWFHQMHFVVFLTPYKSKTLYPLLSNWFIPGRPVLTWLKHCWLGCKESNPTISLNPDQAQWKVLINCNFGIDSPTSHWLGNFWRFGSKVSSSKLKCSVDNKSGNLAGIISKIKIQNAVKKTSNKKNCDVQCGFLFWWVFIWSEHRPLIYWSHI